MKTILLVAAASMLALTGCQTVQEMSAQDDATCQSYGAPFGTEAYFNCRVMQQQRRDYQTAQMNAALSDLGRQISYSRW